MAFDFSFYAQRIVEEVQLGTAAFLDEVRGAMTDVREAMGVVREAAGSLRAPGPHFVQVSVAVAGDNGSVDTMLAAVDDRGRVWMLRMGGDGWKKLPQHPELF